MCKSLWVWDEKLFLRNKNFKDLWIRYLNGLRFFRKLVRLRMDYSLYS